MDILLGGNVSAPTFQTMGYVIDDTVLVCKILLLNVM